MSVQTYTGFWINQADGVVYGSTLTISDRNGAILLALLTILITIAAGQSWKMTAFIIHQWSASPTPRDAVHFQRQSILRNSATPMAAAWLLTLQCWTWRKMHSAVKRRTVPLLLFAATHAIIFALAAIFGARLVTSTDSARLLKPDHCGFTDGIASETLDMSFLTRRAHEIQAATSYGRMCYGKNVTSQNCDEFARSSLEYTTTRGVSCPFEDDICWRNHTVQFESTLINSHTDLGINAPESERMNLRQRSTCSVLKSAGFASIMPSNEAMGWGEESLQRYDYGSSVGDANRLYNWTHLYVIDKSQPMARIPYTVSAYWALANNSGGNWQPISALSSVSADTMISFVEMNSVMFLEPSEDPVFTATTPEEIGGQTFYMPDYLVAAVACQEVVQICTSSMEQCTPWVGRAITSLNSLESLTLDGPQYATALRLLFASLWGHMHWAITGSQSQNLIARDTLFGMQQLPLGSDHWITELSAWFASSLAHLQYKTNEYALGPSQTSNWNSSTWKPWLDDEFSSEATRSQLKSMCDNQISQNSRGTVSFSVLGLALTLALAVIIIASSFIIEPITAWVQSFYARGQYKKLAWISDDFLQVQQMLLEARDVLPPSEDPTTSIPAPATMAPFSGSVLFLKPASASTREVETGEPQSDRNALKAWR